MKKILHLIVIALTALSLSSCLEHGLVELDTYDGCEVTSVYGVYHRYYLSTTIPVSGERQVAQAPLDVSNPVQDVNACTYTFDVSLPTNFPASENGSVNVSKLVVILNISTAAVIEPVDGAPTLGVPGDWSKPNKYKITAGDGTTKTWTVTLNFKK